MQIWNYLKKVNNAIWANEDILFFKEYLFKFYFFMNSFFKHIFSHVNLSLKKYRNNKQHNYTIIIYNLCGE